MFSTETRPELSLFTEHLADLRASGLTDEAIWLSGVFSIQGSDIIHFMGKSYPSVKSALVFPYGNGFYRLKLFPALQTQDGKTIRYLQQANSEPHFFIPRGVEKYLSDPNIMLIITEGEKKALAAYQHGLPCIAISGLWSWMANGKPMSDFDFVAWKERQILIIGDSDIWRPSRLDLRKAVYAFAKELQSRGAIVDFSLILSGAL